MHRLTLRGLSRAGLVRRYVHGVGIFSADQLRKTPLYSIDWSTEPVKPNCLRRKVMLDLPTGITCLISSLDIEGRQALTRYDAIIDASFARHVLGSVLEGSPATFSGSLSWSTLPQFVRCPV